MAPEADDAGLSGAALATMPVALSRCSAELRYLWVSDRFADWLDLPATQIVGRPIGDVLGQEAMDAIRPYIKAVLAGQRVEYELAVRYERIGLRWIHAEYSPTFDRAGVVDGWVACVADVTARKRAEERLSIAHAALGSLFELSVIPSGDDALPTLLQAVVDAAIDVTDADMANLQLYDEASGSLRIAAQRGFEAPFLEHFAVVSDGETACGEAMRRREQVIVDDVATSPLFDARSLGVLVGAGVRAVQSTLMVSREGRLLGVISTHWRERRRPDAERLRSLEIVARQAADALEHRRQQEELRLAHRRKDEFLAVLGHELRNPLSPIVTATELMALRGAGAMEKERQVIERQAKHLVRLVDDLLDVSRITRGKIELRRERVRVARLVDEAVEIASPLLEQRAHRVALDVPRDLAVDVDPARLVQVLANLLTNAARYSEPGGDVRVIAAAAGQTITIRVVDTGVGISPELLPLVFDPFAQEKQGLSRPRGGLGLGLTIVRSLVELHGGTVTGHSDGVGKGSEFSISLPRARGEVAARRPAAPRAVGPSTSGARILVVDDNEDIAGVLAQTLGSLGHEVRVAHDGPSALRLARRFTPAVALLDIGLPVMDGYELAARLREVPALADVRLVALTGYGEPSALRRSRDAGFFAHLVKPVDLTRILEVVQKATAEAVPRPVRRAEKAGERRTKSR
jgi:PAS domain S-box-containing protein